MHCTRPSYGEGHVETVQFGCAVMSLVDLEKADRPAIAVSWQRIELAGAAISAIAVAKFQAMDFPIGHHLPPSTRRCSASFVFTEVAASSNKLLGYPGMR